MSLWVDLQGQAVPPLSGSTPAPGAWLQGGCLCPGVPLPCSQGGIFHLYLVCWKPIVNTMESFMLCKKTPSHKANIYRWKVFILSNARAGKVGLQSHTRKENSANYCAQDTRERRQGSKCGEQRPPCESPIYTCGPVHPLVQSKVQVLVCVTCI